MGHAESVERCCVSAGGGERGCLSTELVSFLWEARRELRINPISWLGVS